MAATIDRDTLSAWVRARADFVLGDTLPRAVYERHHLPGAIHIVSDAVETGGPGRLPNRNRTVVVYCGTASYRRSPKAAAGLDRLGYRDVREYVEGRQDWEAAGLPLASGPRLEPAS